MFIEKNEGSKIHVVIKNGRFEYTENDQEKQAAAVAGTVTGLSRQETEFGFMYLLLMEGANKDGEVLESVIWLTGRDFIHFGERTNNLEQPINITPLKLAPYDFENEGKRFRGLAVYTIENGKNKLLKNVKRKDQPEWEEVKQGKKVYHKSDAVEAFYFEALQNEGLKDFRSAEIEDSEELENLNEGASLLDQD